MQHFSKFHPNKRSLRCHSVSVESLDNIDDVSDDEDDDDDDDDDYRLPPVVDNEEDLDESGVGDTDKMGRGKHCTNDKHVVNLFDETSR